MRCLSLRISFSSRSFTLFYQLFTTEAQEYLEEHVKVSAIEILAVLCDLHVVTVPDDVWKQILDADEV